MRLRSAVFAFVSFLAAPCYAQSTDAALTRYVQAELYPILWTYEACAIRHLRSVAGSAPGSSFDDNEYSIKLVCGGHIDRVKNRLLALGYRSDAVVAEVRTYYDVLRPKVAVVFEGAALTADRDSRMTPDGKRSPPIAASGSGSEDDVDLDRLREVLIKELGQSHRTCIVSNIAEIVPYSSEGAETLVKAIMANCMHFEKKRKQLLDATLQLPQEQAARMVEKVLEEEKLRGLGAIVTHRAKLAKGAAESASGIGPEATGSLGNARY